MNKDKKSLPHFYWTKKNSISCEKILSKATNKGIILDPFMGSGQSLLGIDLNNFKFIGIELNEMPMKMMKAYLNQLTDNNLKDAVIELQNLKKKYEIVYQLECPSCKNNIFYDKVIFDKNNDSINIKSIKINCSKCNYNYDDEILNEELNKQYINKVDFYKKENNKFSDLKLIKNSRIAIKNDMFISDLFSPMNFYILQSMKENKEIKALTEYIISSVLHLIKYTDTKSQSQFPFWIPKENILDRNIFNQFFSKTKELTKFINKDDYKVTYNINDLENNQILLLQGASQNKLKEIPDNFVDILFTDPPYYDQVAYSEYLITWDFFLNYQIDYDNEIVVSNREYKKANRNDYLENIKLVFTECYKKLKDKAEIFIYFKDSKQKNYLDFVNVLIDIGYVYEKQIHLNKNKITYKQNNTKKTTSRGDCIIYLRKDISFVYKEQKHFNKESFFDYLYQIISIYMENRTCSTGELLDNIIYKEMVINNISDTINEKDIISFLEKKFNFINGEWLLNE